MKPNEEEEFSTLYAIGFYLRFGLLLVCGAVLFWFLWGATPW